jgi:hypothetical protein
MRTPQSNSPLYSWAVLIALGTSVAVVFTALFDAIATSSSLL